MDRHGTSVGLEAIKSLRCYGGFVLFDRVIVGFIKIVVGLIADY